MGWRNESLIKWSRSHDQDDRYAIHGKNLKKTSSLEPKGRWPWKLVHVCSIEYSSTTKFVQITWPWDDLTYFTARSNLAPYAFVWVKGKTMDFFSGTIVVFDIKVGRCSQLNMYMSLYENIKGQGHSLTLVQIFQIQYFKLLFLNNHGADWSQCGASSGWRNESLFKWSKSHDQDGHHVHIW